MGSYYWFSKIFNLMKNLNIKPKKYHKISEIQCILNSKENLNKLIFDNDKLNNLESSSLIDFCLHYSYSIEKLDNLKFIILQKESNGYNVNLCIYNFLIAAYSKSSAPESAEEILLILKDHQTLKPDIYSYNLLILGYLIANQREKVMEYYNKMIQFNIAPNLTTFTYLIKIYTLKPEKEYYENMFKILKDLKSYNLIATPQIYVSMIRACTFFNDKRAASLLKEMKDCGYYICESLLNYVEYQGIPYSID